MDQLPLLVRVEPTQDPIPRTGTGALSLIVGQDGGPEAQRFVARETGTDAIIGSIEIDSDGTVTAFNIDRMQAVEGAALVRHAFRLGPVLRVTARPLGLAFFVSLGFRPDAANTPPARAPAVPGDLFVSQRGVREFVDGEHSICEIFIKRGGIRSVSSLSDCHEFLGEFQRFPDAIVPLVFDARGRNDNDGGPCVIA